MTEDEAQKRVNEIRMLEDDNEIAHVREDLFYRDVLRVIASGKLKGKKARAVALIALSTESHRIREVVRVTNAVKSPQGETSIRISRKRNAGGWTVWAKYPWQEQGKKHHVSEVGTRRVIVCDTCEQGCIGVIAIQKLKDGGYTAPIEEETSAE